MYEKYIGKYYMIKNSECDYHYFKITGYNGADFITTSYHMYLNYCQKTINEVIRPCFLSMDGYVEISKGDFDLAVYSCLNPIVDIYDLIGGYITVPQKLERRNIE
ncbi:hypothetical protein [Clostridium sp. AF32-12BH]|uniref:hypothetical protein n=1 Tax=Clostridium sp. AF32-12BH TaxID=2292006 RepID=UPI000E4A3F52|nr:hypothetical protein [Clostridium sp. AF32-12BH]RHP47049.1 hypothetical protein DWZ40_09105 [Clostridium sp. AF32-12BH]